MRRSGVSDAWRLHSPGFSYSSLAAQDGSLRGSAARCQTRGPYTSPGLWSSPLRAQDGSRRGSAVRCQTRCPYTPPGLSSSALAIQDGPLRGIAVSSRCQTRRPTPSRSLALVTCHSGWLPHRRRAEVSDAWPRHPPGLPSSRLAAQDFSLGGGAVRCQTRGPCTLQASHPRHWQLRMGPVEAPQ